MAIIRTAVSISVFSIICCIAFVVFKILLFYEYVTIHKRQYEITWIINWKPTAFYDFGIAMIIEMTGYFAGILANAMLVLGINSARYKNEYFFFRFYYIASIWLSIVTMYQGLELELVLYVAFSITNLIFLYAVAVIQRRLVRERDENLIFDIIT